MPRGETLEAHQLIHQDSWTGPGPPDTHEEDAMDLDGRLTSLKKRRVMAEPSGMSRGAELGREDVLHQGNRETRERDHPGSHDVRVWDHPGTHGAGERDHQGSNSPKERDQPRTRDARERGASGTAAAREGGPAASEQAEHPQQKLHASWTVSTHEASPGGRVGDPLRAPQPATRRMEEVHLSSSDQPLSRKSRNPPRERGHDYTDTHYTPRNGEGMRAWLGRVTGEDLTWAGGQASAYPPPYLYPLSLCGQDTQGPGGTIHLGHPAPEDALRRISAHCHLLAGVKLLEGLPVLTHPMDPVSALEELTYSGNQAPSASAVLEKGPPSLASNWHLGLYPPAWSHLLSQQRSPHGVSPQPAPENGLSARRKEYSNRKENIVHLLAQDPSLSPARSPPGPPSSCPSSGPGEARLGPDPSGPSRRDQVFQAEGPTIIARGHKAESDTQSYWPPLPVQPGLAGSETTRLVASERVVGTAHQAVTASAESKDDVRSNLSNQSAPSASRWADQPPVGCHTTNAALARPGHAGEVRWADQPPVGCHTTNAALARPGHAGEGPPSQSHGPSDEPGVRGVKRTHEDQLALDGCWDGKPCGPVSNGPPVEMHSKLGHGSKAGKMLALAGPQRNHTKLKQTWLTRHSKQFGGHAIDTPDQGDRASRVPEKEGLVEKKEATKRPCETTSEEKPRTGPSSGPTAKRSCTGMDNHWANNAGSDQEVPVRGAEPKDPAEPKGRAEPGDDRDTEREPTCAQPTPGHQARVSLQTVPCSLLPEAIERCCSCASRRQEGPTQTGCRFLHFRRLALHGSGRMEADGLSMVDEVCNGDASESASGDERAREEARSPSPAKYLLSTLGDQFCDIVRRDREALSRCQKDSKRAVAWRKVHTGLQACDTCHGPFFNSHWSCSRCGFQMCTECHRSKEKTEGKEPQGEEVPTMRCVRGPQHSLRFMVPTQFILTNVLSDLWKAMHDIRLKYDISANCHCRQSFLTDAVLLGISLSKDKEVKGSPAAPLQAAVCEEKTEFKAIKQERPESVDQSLSDRGPKGTVQSSTLCDLLTSTAVRLCLGQTGVRMAFAPVSPAMPTDDRISSILDNIIAQVVERKIQEKQQVEAGGARSPSPPEPTLYFPVPPPGGILWLQDPNNTSNYRRFQDHWRQCQQPVLVSGLNKKMKRSLWGPGPLSRELGQQLAEVPTSRTPHMAEPVSSKEFWDGLLASTETVQDEKIRGSQWRWEWDLGELRPSWMENLHSCLPLPEYCRPGGKLNLATYLPNDQLWLCPRISAVHGMKFDNRSIGTKKLTAEMTDFLNLLVHVDDPDEAFSEGRSFQQEILLRTDGDSTDGLLKEQLWSSRDTPGALWHIFQAEDAEQIRKFLEKVCGDQAESCVSRTGPSDQQSSYLNLALRRRLREECGVKSWALLQFLGDAVVVPAGSPYQVQSFTNTISVTQGFLSPENAPLSAHLMRTARKTQPSIHNLSAQMEGAIFGAVKDAVETLQAYN